MNARDEIAAQVRDLLDYFPGRGRLPLVWLVLIPAFIIFSLVFLAGGPRIPAGSIPYSVYTSGGASVLWIYFATVLVLLVRMNHSDRSSWRESATIIASSVAYGFIVGLPALLVSVGWSAYYVGISILSVSELLVGVFEILGAVLLLAIILGAVAHYAGPFIALFLFLAKTVYVYLLPVSYSITLVPAKWHLLQAATPLAPAIAVLRAGIMNNHAGEMILPLYWCAAIIHAIAGYALAFWIWKRISNHWVAARVA
jgi:ABC-type polysaccharide/polyol phosphate export permease